VDARSWEDATRTLGHTVDMMASNETSDGVVKHGQQVHDEFWVPERPSQALHSEGDEVPVHRRRFRPEPRFGWLGGTNRAMLMPDGRYSKDVPPPYRPNANIKQIGQLTLIE
jgi:hypothetical protein